jgi:hypothetical protein
VGQSVSVVHRGRYFHPTIDQRLVGQLSDR